MPVDMGTREIGPGWGCSCKSFRLGEPTPEQALAALARSANVTVEQLGPYQFTTWTDPDNRYSVTFDPDRPGGACKHVISCLVTWAPWHRQLALGADGALEEIKRLRKELKKRDREITKLRNSS